METNGLIENPSPRCACVLLLDVSSSMCGEPIAELNTAVRQFMEEVLADDFAANSVELGIVTFGGTVTVKRALRPIVAGEPEVFYASGDTPMGGAVEKAISLVEERKAAYRKNGVSYYQPWIVLMSDGEPTDYYSETARRLKEMANNRKAVVLCVGIGQRCNLHVLAEFSPDGRPPLRLSGIKFREFFTWLSASMRAVSASTPGTSIHTPPVDGWAEITV